jgi:hypothetical protein
LLCEKDALKNVAKILAQDPGKIPYVGAPSGTGKTATSFVWFEYFFDGVIVVCNA